MTVNWKGVYPALTTQFKPDQSLDFDATARHLDRMIHSGIHGVILLGSVGENTALEYSEKLTFLREMLPVIAGRIPTVTGVAEYTTALACRYASDAERIGVDGLMVLPAYAYVGDERETAAHYAAVFGATRLPCMLYNNPIAYGTDVLPEQLSELARALPNLVAVKESSADVRRVTAIRAAAGDRLEVLVGVDDLIVEGVAAGAVGWIAGLADALPAESVRLFELALAGKHAEARSLYNWFLPLLRLDTVPKFVQLIKLVQVETGLGSEAVRPPRLPLADAERAAAIALVREALAKRPALA